MVEIRLLMQDSDVSLGSGREMGKNNTHGREPRFTLSQHRSIGDLFQFVVKITKLSTSGNNFYVNGALGARCSGHAPGNG